MHKIHLAFIIVVLGVSNAQQIWNGNFTGNWEQHWNISSSGSFGESNRAIVSDPLNKFGQVLRVLYPKGSYAPHGDIVGGTQWVSSPIKPYPKTLCLSYYLMFEKGFDFVKGGKLPGFFGTAPGEEFNKCRGGKEPAGDDCWSSRFMFRTDGAGEVYGYILPLNSTQCDQCWTVCNPSDGQSLGRGLFWFKPGTWQQVQQQVVLNDPNESNGGFQVWVDGVKKADIGGLKMRTIPGLGINGIFFSTFFGGGDPSWATQKDVHAYFTDFSISEKCVGDQSMCPQGCNDKGTCNGGVCECESGYSGSGCECQGCSSVSVSVEKQSCFSSGATYYLAIKNIGSKTINSITMDINFGKGAYGVTVSKSWEMTVVSQTPTKLQVAIKQSIAPGATWDKAGFIAKPDMYPSFQVLQAS